MAAWYPGARPNWRPICGQSKIFRVTSPRISRYGKEYTDIVSRFQCNRQLIVNLQALKSKTWMLITAAVLVLTGVIYYMTQYVHCSVEEINADNSIINGKTLSGGYLEGLHLRNMTFKNTTFRGLELVDFVFENVIFENCLFSKVNAWDGTMINVTFKGGRMTYEGAPQYDINRTYFETTQMDKVLFEGVVMENARLNGISGSLTFISMRDFEDYGRGVVIIGNDLRFRADNCAVKDVDLFGLFGDSTGYVTNSVLENSGFGSSEARVIYVENCSLVGSDIDNPRLLVVQDSKVCVSMFGAEQSKCYFVNCQFIPKPKTGWKSAVSGHEVHIFGNNDTQYIKLTAGNIYLYDMELPTPLLFHADKEQLDSLNLRNVTIRGGEFWSLKLRGGSWQDVAIYPPIMISGSPPAISGLHVYNVTFPQGNPFVAKDGSPIQVNIPAQKADHPFEWPEIHVPTAQELGLTD
jgi:uncharacterized protein YjbI with pentapeptide repeats